MPRLLRTEQIARAADLQIAHRNLEARAELGVFPDCLEPLLCNLRENLSPPERQICIRMTRRPADSAAQLVQLRQTQLIRVFNDQRIHVRNIDAGFDDCCADQNLNLPVCHRLHDIRKLLLIHLSVRHGDRYISQPVLELRRALVDRFHAVVKVIDLPAARKLSADCLVQNPVAVLQHEGLHRIAVVRRLLDGRHVAKPRQRHIERPGNRRRRKRQHVHAARNFLQPLLVAHAEALLLVHNQKPQILEMHVLLQQLVRADDQVNLARRQLLQRLFHLRRCAEPGQNVDGHRERAEALERR